MTIMWAVKDKDGRYASIEHEEIDARTIAMDCMSLSIQHNEWCKMSKDKIPEKYRVVKVEVREVE